MSCHLRHIAEVDKLDRVAVANAIVDAQILVLVAIILVRLGHAHGGEYEATVDGKEFPVFRVAQQALKR